MRVARIAVTQQFLRYGAVGLTGTALYAALAVLLIQGFAVYETLATVVAFTVMVVFNHAASRRWVFGFSGTGSLQRFAVVSLVGLALNAGIMHLTVHVLGWWYLYSLAIAVAVVPLSNFVLHSLWTFRARKPPG